jgi:hypothetical protein
LELSIPDKNLLKFLCQQPLGDVILELELKKKPSWIKLGSGIRDWDYT